MIDKTKNTHLRWQSFEMDTFIVYAAKYAMRITKRH